MVVLGHGNGKSPGLAAESARPGGVGGASDGSCKRKRFLEGRGGRAGQPAAQPVVGWKARELPEAERDVWSGPKTTRARPPLLSILPVVQPRTGHHHQGRAVRRGRICARKFGSLRAAAMENGMRAHFPSRLVGGGLTPRPRRWSATAACFWKAADRRREEEKKKRKGSTATQDGATAGRIIAGRRYRYRSTRTLYGPAFMPWPCLLHLEIQKVFKILCHIESYGTYKKH